MKICPACRTTYDDDGLNFCLEDGSVLTFASSQGAPTVVMGQPRRTDQPQGSAMPTSWGGQSPPAHSPQPAKNKSRSWIWVLGIFAILTLVCGGGLVGFFVYVASIANTSTANKTANNTWAKKAATPSPSASPTATVASTSDVQEIDLSDWVKEPTEWLDTKMEGAEFLMTSKQKDYYYVLVAKDEDAAGAKAARVTVRNPDDEDVSMGYGLVFHSQTTPLTNDYAFLIDTKRKKYRVVRHEDSREKTITAWTSSNFIKDGGDPNLLEARDTGDKIELYLNGQLASTIANKQGPKAGVPGLYVGDGGRIAFRKLEIVK